MVPRFSVLTSRSQKGPRGISGQLHDMSLYKGTCNTQRLVYRQKFLLLRVQSREGTPFFGSGQRITYPKSIMNRLCASEVSLVHDFTSSRVGLHALDPEMRLRCAPGRFDWRSENGIFMFLWKTPAAEWESLGIVWHSQPPGGHGPCNWTPKPLLRLLHPRCQ